MNIARLFTQTVSVETYLGTGPYGDDFAAPVNVACYVTGSQNVTISGTTLVINADNIVYAATSTLPTVPPVAGQFTPQSKVNGTGRVSTVKPKLAPRPRGSDHVEVRFK